MKPSERNLFEIVAYLRKLEGRVLKVVDRAAWRSAENRSAAGES
jgi:hypothetical protein